MLPDSEETEHLPASACTVSQGNINDIEPASNNVRHLSFNIELVFVS